MRLIDRIIKLLVTFKFKHRPEWLATNFSIDETTDIHVVVETWRDGVHWFGTRSEIK